MQTLDLRGYSYQDRHGLLPTLTSAVAECGGWVLERRTTSASTMEFRIEIQLQAIVELYAELVSCGLELTRSTHDTLTGLCTSRHHLGCTSFAAIPGRRVLTLRLELSFLDDVTLHSVLMIGSDLA